MSSRVVCAFPGTGKSYYVKNGGGNSIDLDSSAFSKEEDFPNNYITEIRRLVDSREYDNILVSTHAGVINGLKSVGIRPLLIYPHRGLKHEYMKRYAERGSTGKFLEYMDAHWANHIESLKACRKVDRIVLSRGKYLSDFIDNTVRYVPKSK